jgi:uncharacterized protein YdhG (YjbR/CyaY superfamily)
VPFSTCSRTFARHLPDQRAVASATRSQLKETAWSADKGGSWRLSLPEFGSELREIIHRRNHLSPGDGDYGWLPEAIL